jgi:hypothetical protein
VLSRQALYHLSLSLSLSKNLDLPHTIMTWPVIQCKNLVMNFIYDLDSLLEAGTERLSQTGGSLSLSLSVSLSLTHTHTHPFTFSLFFR